LSLWLIRKDLRENGGGLRLRVFAGMAAESVAYALAFGVVVGMITARLLGVLATLAIGPAQALAPSRQLMISLGAGLYEELLFRVVLVSALAYVARSLLGWSKRVAGFAAVLLGAAIFSGFHYIGAFGDPLTLESFTYRMIGGLFFSALFLLRGFGVTAWTHALYDVFLLSR
ncbi:MAG: CPBP family glutamic-type intramembrane protease, partial [Gemmatimonadaceae bacterium]